MPKASQEPKIVQVDLRIKPKNHTYPTMIITTAVRILQQATIGLTSCQHIIEHMVITLGLGSRIPCRSSMANWRDKFGHHAETSVTFSPSERWAVLLDESITIGTNKVLLIVGVELTRHSFAGALRFEDCKVLDVALHSGWTADAIRKRLTNLQAQGLVIEYTISDRGPNLVKCCKDINLLRLGDCSHEIALALKREYGQRADYMLFEQQCTAFKRRGAISRYAHLLPPKLNTHSRFMNLDKGVNWAYKTLKILRHHANHHAVAPFVDKLQWLVKHESLIVELTATLELVERLLSALKEEGFSHQLCRWAMGLIRSANEVPNSLRLAIARYLIGLKDKTEEDKRYLCSTDIVESLFNYSKAKKYLANDRLCQLLYAKTSRINPAEVHRSMESMTLDDLKKHKQSTRGHPSTQQLRREIYALVA